MDNTADDTQEPRTLPSLPRAPLDPIRQFIVDALERIGVSQNEASRRMGRNQAFLNQHIYRGTPRKLSDDDRRNLARIIGCGEDQLKYSPTVPSDQPTSARLPLRGRVGLRDVPLYRASTVRSEIAAVDDEPAAYVARPEALLGNAGAWACRLADQGLCPAFHLGDLLYFDPSYPAQADDLVCVAHVTPDGMRREIGYCTGDAPRGSLRLRSEAGQTSFLLQPHMLVGRLVGMVR